MLRRMGSSFLTKSENQDLIRVRQPFCPAFTPDDSYPLNAVGLKNA